MSSVSVWYKGFLSLTLFVAQWTVGFAVRAESGDPIAVVPPSGKIPDNLVSWSVGPLHSRYAIVADKAQRTLTVWENVDGVARFLEAHPMDIGKKDGPKEKKDDHKTPEGIYFPLERKEGPGLDFNEYGVRAFTLDYPNFFDRRKNKTGHGIWLHAIPETKSLLRGSRGCVVVRNEIIKKITPYVALNKTPVIIQDKVNYVTPEEVQKKSKALTEWLDQWRTDWASKNIQSYMAHYATDFFALKMDRTAWQSYKQGLADRYKFIEIKTVSPALFVHKEYGIIRFLQDYKSDGLADFGLKTLYLSGPDSNFKIQSEEWRAVDTALLANSKVN
jgi:murein L,D-transpeptidase YafK